MGKALLPFVRRCRKIADADVVLTQNVVLTLPRALEGHILQGAPTRNEAVQLMHTQTLLFWKKADFLGMEWDSLWL